MGRDKARLQHRGRAWSTRMAERLDELFVETLLVGGHPESKAPGRRVVDPDGPVCALRGLIGALQGATNERVVIVATDLPLLDSDLILALTAWPEADAVIPVDRVGDQPLCGIYRRVPCLAAARQRFESKQLALTGWLEQFDTVRVPLSDFGFGMEDAAWLTNVNTPEDLERLGAG